MAEERSERKRVGLMVPSSNTTMEADFHRGLKGAGVHTARMFLEYSDRADEIRMMEEFAPGAAAALKTVAPQLVVFGCTSASTLFGPQYDEEMRARLAREAGAPVLGVITSVGEALRARGMRRLAVFTPYVDELNHTVRASLEGAGFQVASLRGMGLHLNLDIGAVTPAEILAFAQAEPLPEGVDGLFFSCTNWRAVEALELIEQAFPLPVVTSNQAALEATERELLKF